MRNARLADSVVWKIAKTLPVLERTLPRKSCVFFDTLFVANERKEEYGLKGDLGW